MTKKNLNNEAKKVNPEMIPCNEKLVLKRGLCPKCKTDDKSKEK